ncbi:MAG: hypothetical protein R2757_16130 [Draconibacterium sp.]
MEKLLLIKAMNNHKTTHYAKNQCKRGKTANETLPTKAELHQPRRNAIIRRGWGRNQGENLKNHCGMQSDHVVSHSAPVNRIPLSNKGKGIKTVHVNIVNRPRTTEKHKTAGS